MEMVTAYKMKHSINSTRFCVLRPRLASGFKILAAWVLLAVIWPATVHAAINSAAPSPANISVAVKGSKTFSVVWSVSRTGPAGGGTFNVTSPAALLQVNGVTIASLGSSLTQPSNLNAGVTGILTFSETLTLSPTLARRIASAGAGSVTISREFTDGIAPATGTIQVSTGSAGPLAVRRIELKFENDARTDVIKQGDVIRAVAYVSFRSNGLLRGEWRIIDPSASLGGNNSGRRVLQVVRQQLVSSGEGRTRIVSPPLPTKTNGLYLVSFSVEDTDGTIDVPILRYFVLEGRDDVPPVNLSVLTPGDGAPINSDTVFSWNAMQGAQAYKLEILEPGSEEPITGKIVPGTDLKLSLSALAFEDLVSEKTYDWRVRAFAKGQVVGQSKRMSLHIP